MQKKSLRRSARELGLHRCVLLGGNASQSLLAVASTCTCCQSTIIIITITTISSPAAEAQLGAQTAFLAFTI